MSSYGGRLQVVDVTDPLNARRVAALMPDRPQYDVVVVGTHAYLMDTGASIRVRDVSDPGDPIQLGFFASSQYSSSVLTDTVSITPAPVAAGNFAKAISNGPPELSDPQTSAQGGFFFVLAGVPHTTYVLQASTDQTSWAAVTPNGLPASGALRITDPHAVEFSQRYYCAVRQP